MNLIKRNNGDTLLRSFMSDFFDTDRFFSNSLLLKPDWIPAVNIVENDADFRIELAAPGMKKDDFKVNIENGILNISAETKKEEEERKNNFTRKEFSYESFQRSFTLPENASEEKIGAKYEDGVLKLTLAKKVPVTHKKKEIAIA